VSFKIKFYCQEKIIIEFIRKKAFYTRTCSPAKCDLEERCITDPKCIPKPPAFPIWAIAIAVIVIIIVLILFFVFRGIVHR
jgi:hypothetical protein